MRKAYDTILSDYVDAESAAKSGGFEPYRYECACCWEEVRLCAADSTNQATHFRHRSGNNNVECDNYLGNQNTIINKALSRGNIRDKIEFYFSNETKMFSIGIKFTAQEIETYQYNGTSIQVRTSFTAKPLLSIPIRSNRFLPNVSELLPICNFSWEYYISLSNNSKPYNCHLFRNDRGSLYPSFFKIKAYGDDNTFQAKLVRSETLYTNTPYFIVFSHQYHTLSFQNDVKVHKVIKFRTMQRDFAGVIITFTKKTSKIEQQLEAWKYKLETNEALTLLWPPSPQVNESMIISTKHAYIFSSFELHAHGNINVHFNDIVKLGDGISKISINSQTKVFKKNAELMLDEHKGTTDVYDVLSVTHETSKNYVAPDNGAFLFNRCGVSLLSKGMSTSLTIGSEVRHYSFGYLDRITMVPNNARALVGDRLLHDILIHYKRTEIFNWSDYESLDLSSVAYQYIKSCEITGCINSAAKHFIEEGRI